MNTTLCARRAPDRRHHRAGRAPRWLAELTEREREVLRCLAEGMSNQEVADELFISTATVKTHVASLLAKLVVRDRVQLVVAAYRTGFVPAGQLAPPPRS